MRALHGIRPPPRLERRVFQGGVSINEDPSSSTGALHRNPVARFILPNDELQALALATRLLRFADIRGNEHFHAYGDAIRGVDRGGDLPPSDIKNPFGIELDAIKFL